MTLAQVIDALQNRLIANPKLADKEVYLELDSMWTATRFEFVSVHDDGGLVFGKD